MEIRRVVGILRLIMQQEAKHLTKRQWLLIALSATLLVILAVAQGIYRGLNFNDFGQMTKRGRIVACCDNSPWGFSKNAEDGERGIGYKIMHDFADSLGLELEIVIKNNPDDVLKELEKGYIDVVILPTAMTRQIKAKYINTIPLLCTPLVAVYNKNHGEKITLDNISQQQLTVQPNHAIELRLKHLENETGQNIRHNTVNDISLNELIRLVSLSAINGTICPKALADTYCEEYDDLGYTPISVEQEYVWVLKKNRQQTLKVVNEFLIKQNLSNCQ